MTEQTKAYHHKPPDVFVGSSCICAHDMIGPVYSNMDVFGLTAGQFSFIDILAHTLKYTGPANLVIAVWTASATQLMKIKTLLNDSCVLSVKWIVDRSLKVVSNPAYNLLLESFKNEVIRTTSCHAKFMLIYNEQWNIVVRTSMNMNANSRIESFTVTESRPFLKFMLDIVETLFKNTDPVNNFNAQSQKELNKVIFPETCVVEFKEKPICLMTQKI